MKTQDAVPAAWPELEREIDESVIATVQRLLDSRRRAIGGAAPRAQYAAEIRFCQRLEEAVRRHLDLVRGRMEDSGWSGAALRVAEPRKGGVVEGQRSDDGRG